ncbi:MAG: hypothetical protein NTV21_10725 [Planctomycetota bacterium]|nr:hypothetical protein [Planctomycetota bacterium]
MKRAFALLLCTALAFACRSSEGTRRSVDVARVDVRGEIVESAPTLQVQGVPIRYAVHEIELDARQPVRVSLTSDSEEFDPILECRPADGRPDETLRGNDSQALGNGAQLDLLPLRSGPWIVYVGDAHGRPGPYRLQIERIAERTVFTASAEVAPALTGTEPPVSLFTQVFAGRRYRVEVVPTGFPAHLALAAPCVEALQSNALALEFEARRTGQVVMQVSSLSLANGPFTLRVTELW